MLKAWSAGVAAEPKTISYIFGLIVVADSRANMVVADAAFWFPSVVYRRPILPS